MLESLLNFIRPPDDADAKTLKRWRWNVALALLAFTGFGAWTFTPMGFARAQEVEKKITQVVEPIQKQIEQIGKDVDKLASSVAQTKALLIRKLAADLEREIVDAKSRQCKAQNVEAATYFRGQVLEKQAEYLDLTQREFRLPACAET